MFVEMAVQAAVESAMDSLLKDVCDLEIRGEGIYKRMSGMVKIEADRKISKIKRRRSVNRSGV